MKIQKEKLKVGITCEDGSLLKGFVHINPGERLIDFLNDSKRNFIAVTNVEFFNLKEIHSFKLFNEASRKRNVVILNKNYVKLVEEL